MINLVILRQTSKVGNYQIQIKVWVVGTGHRALANSNGRARPLSCSKREECEEDDEGFHVEYMLD